MRFVCEIVLKKVLSRPSLEKTPANTDETDAFQHQPRRPELGSSLIPTVNFNEVKSKSFVIELDHGLRPALSCCNPKLPVHNLNVAKVSEFCHDHLLAYALLCAYLVEAMSPV